MIELLVDYREAWTRGLLMTLKLFISATFLGGLLGMALMFLGKVIPQFRLILAALAFTTLCVPALVFLFWVHYPLQQILNITVTPFLSSLTVFTWTTAIFVADSLLKSFDAIPRHLVDSVKTCGIPYRQAFMRIYLPISFRIALPALLVIMVFVLHGTLLSSFISYDELFRTAQRINAQEHKPVVVYSVIICGFSILSAPLVYFSRALSVDSSQRFE